TGHASTVTQSGNVCESVIGIARFSDRVSAKNVSSIDTLPVMLRTQSVGVPRQVSCAPANLATTYAKPKTSQARAKAATRQSDRSPAGRPHTDMVAKKNCAPSIIAYARRIFGTAVGEYFIGTIVSRSCRPANLSPDRKRLHYQISRGRERRTGKPLNE